MSLLDKYYPELEHTRCLVESRLDNLQHLAQRSPSFADPLTLLHHDHHQHIDHNLTHIYSLLTKSAASQSLLQEQINYLHRKSDVLVHPDKYDYDLRIKHLQEAYRVSEDRAYSLRQRMKLYYPNKEYRAYQNYPVRSEYVYERSPKSRYGQENYPERHGNAFGLKHQNCGRQEKDELRQLEREKEVLNNIFRENQMEEEFYSLPLSYSVEAQPSFGENYLRSNKRDSSVDKSKDREFQVLESRDPEGVRERRHTEERSVQVDTDGIMDQFVLGKSEQKSDEEHQKDNEILIHEGTAYSESINRSKLIDDNIPTNYHSRLLSNSRSPSTLKPSHSHSLYHPEDPYSESQLHSYISHPDTILTTPATPSKPKSPKTKLAGCLSYTRLSPAKRYNPKKPQSAEKKRLDSSHLQSNHKGILGRIQKRIQNAWAIYQDSSFRNSKHQKDHLLNTYSKELRLRDEMCQKVEQHPLVQRKYGLM